MATVWWRRRQCAFMLYDQTAGRTFFLFFLLDLWEGGWCLASARSGLQAGQTMGRFVDGECFEDFANDAAEN